MKNVAILVSLSCVLGCGTAPAPPSIAAAPTATTTTTAGAPSSTASAEGEAMTSPTTAPAQPPSGVWDLRVRVVRDTCAPKVAAELMEKGLLVYGHPSKGKIVLNVPLIATKNAAARSDVVAEVGSTIDVTTKPDPACPTYAVQRSIVVKEVAHDRLVVVRTDTYGDRTGCAAGTPVACVAEWEHTYTLVRAECEAACSASIDLKDPKVPKLKCVCP